MPIRWARTIALTATTAVAALCAAGTVGAGPISASGAGICMPWPENGLATVGQWLPNTGPAKITLTDVALREPAPTSRPGRYVR
ncbi:hypothetical protein [Jiangella endophytica]|uniref:hypothetical protein n=1 Tax=Jiangella endophytica TaxID=1623398 RepID=UPI000E34FF4A|nr:hypothetical protein [Jiangella endophytica]